MHVDLVRDALHKQPFQPFLLRLADGRSVYVAHPDFVAVSPRQVHVISPVDESVSWLEPLLIVSIEFVGAAKVASTSDGNGS
jgi:hypothetical protein